MYSCVLLYIISSRQLPYCVLCVVALVSNVISSSLSKCMHTIQALQVVFEVFWIFVSYDNYFIILFIVRCEKKAKKEIQNRACCAID